MSTSSEVRNGVVPSANDDANKNPEKSSSERRPEVGGSPASADESHSEPMLIVEQQELPLPSSSMPPLVNPTQGGDDLGALTTFSCEGSTNSWLHEPNVAPYKTGSDEMIGTLRPCITDMDEDESTPPDVIGSNAEAEAVSRAPVQPTTALVEKDVEEYIHSIEQLGSFDSVDWTVSDGSSPFLSALLRSGDHPTREDRDATFASAAAADLPSPEDIGMYQPYHSFASALLPLEHLLSFELTSSSTLARSAMAPAQPFQTSPVQPLGASTCPDPHKSGGMGAADDCDDLKQSPYIQPTSLGVFALKTPRQASTGRQSVPSSSGAAKLASKESRTPHTTSPSAPRCASESTNRANPKTDRKTGVDAGGATAKEAGGIASTPRKVGRWTREEDDILVAAVAKMKDRRDRVIWSAVAREFHGSRNATQCKARWGKSLSPAVDRGPFTAEEDAIIVDARQRGMRFCDISRLCLPGRSSDRIRFRYTHALDPSRKEKKDVPWSDAEKQVLVDAQKAMGNKWTTIAKLLPGRSDNDVKNMWYNQKDSIRRAQNRLVAEQNRQGAQSSLSQSSVADLPEPDDLGDSPVSTPTAV